MISQTGQQSHWASLKGKMSQQWSKLSENDFDSVEKNPEDIIAGLEKVYGYSRDQARDEFERFKERNSSLFASSSQRSSKDEDELVPSDNDPESVDPATNERRQ